MLKVPRARTRNGAKRRVARRECGCGAGGPSCVTAASSRWAGTIDGMIDSAEKIAGLGDAARCEGGVCSLPPSSRVGRGRGRAAGAGAGPQRVVQGLGEGLAAERRTHRAPHVREFWSPRQELARDGRVGISLGLGSPGDRTPVFEPRRGTDSEPPRYKVLARATLFALPLHFAPHACDKRTCGCAGAGVVAPGV